MAWKSWKRGKKPHRVVMPNLVNVGVAMSFIGLDRIQQIVDTSAANRRKARELAIYDVQCKQDTRHEKALDLIHATA